MYGKRVDFYNAITYKNKIRTSKRERERESLNKLLPRQLPAYHYYVFLHSFTTLRGSISNNKNQSIALFPLPLSVQPPSLKFFSQSDDDGNEIMTQYDVKNMD